MTDTKRDQSGGTERDQRESFFARHEWTVIGVLALLTYCVACVGYVFLLKPGTADSPYTWLDMAYLSMKLFILDGPEETAHWPLYMELARAMAPVIVVYTAVKAVWRVIDQEVALYGLLLYKRRYVVICGIGETGYRIARDYCENSTKRVVVVDDDPLNALAADLKRHGAIVLFGNAMDPLTLIKARAIFAKDIFVCTSDDKANIAIAKTAERLTRRLPDREVRRLEAISNKLEPSIAGEPPDVALRCFLCVDEPDIYEIFATHSFFETNTTRFSIRLFNRRETIARNIFRICAPDLYYLPFDEESKPMHALFVGFQALSRELILQLALTGHYTDFRPPRATVLCNLGMEEDVEQFLHRYPQLNHTVDLRFHYADPMTVSPADLQKMEEGCQFDVSYVAMKRDVQGILTARRINRLRRHEGMRRLNFVVCLNQQNFLSEIIDDDFPPMSLDKSHLPKHEPIEYFETLDETISIDVVVNEALDAMARTLHNAYLQTQLDAGGETAQNASLVRWSDLPVHKKKANQHAAAHIDVKLRISSCEARPLDDPITEVDFPPEDETMELLAQLEHRRWMADKYIAGYSYGPERDEDRMLHPDLIPWEQLTEADKQKDRDSIRQIPTMLSLQDLKVCGMPRRSM